MTYYEAAKCYLAMGLHPIPCAPRSKRPLVSWQKYQTEPPLPEEIDAWWGQWPDANVALVLGRGTFAVDLDGGMAAAELLFAKGVALPAGPTNRTAKGFHLFLAADRPVPDRVALVRAPDGSAQVDIRGVGIVVVPPSIHPSGIRYEWVQPISLPLPSAPSALLDLIDRMEKANPPRNGSQSWVAEALRGVPKGLRDETCTRLAGYLVGLNIDTALVEVMLSESFAKNCTPPFSQSDVRKCVQSIARRERALPPKADYSSEPVLVRLSEVEPEEVDWLWPGRIPRGKLTLLVGDPGLGKSFVLLDAAARVTRGRPWPDRSEAPKGNVVLLTAEDGLADTVRPRLDALTGDPSMVTVLRAVKQEGIERPISLAVDLPALDAAIAQTGSTLVIVDPVSAYLGKTDSYKDSEVRGVLAPLAALAERHGVAVVGILHLSKDAQRLALYRAQGSVAFVAASRSVLAVAKDPENDERRLLTALKLNLAPLPPTLAFHITSSGLDWEPNPVDIDAETVLGGAGAPEDRAERQDVDEFLQEFLKDGPAAASQVFKAARANGLADRTLYRAKRRLGIRAERIGGLGKDGQWFWSFPVKVATGAPKTATPGGMAALGERREQKAESARGSAKAATSGAVATLGGPESSEWDEV